MSRSVGYYTVKPERENTSLPYCCEFRFYSIIFLFRQVPFPRKPQTATGAAGYHRRRATARLQRDYKGCVVIPAL